MKRKLFTGLLILIFVAIGWYLFLKPNDYQVTFKTKLIPPVANQSIKLWADGLSNSNLENQKNLQNFKHRIVFGDSTYIYEWKITQIDDSTSQVKALITDINNSLANKIAIPFSDTDFEKRSKNTLRNLRDVLKEHSEQFRVSVIGEETIPETYCAYVTYESSQKNKAFKMMQGYPFMNMIQNLGIELNGPPFIEVNTWYVQKDSLSFNFCYPIIHNDSLPEIKGLQFKKIQKQKALKAIYNGNYITSDRAWYALRAYAKKNNIALENKPYEFFLNNPNMGGDELNWEAQIYMPLKN